MGDAPQPLPVTWENSAGDAHKQETAVLPDEVSQCLGKNRYLHLATASRESKPDIALMSYTYCAASPFSPATPVVVMTSNPGSNKHNNLLANPDVSLLVHDWATPRTPVLGANGGTTTATTTLSAYLAFMNMTVLAPPRISATLRGRARLAARGSAEERYYLEKHVDNLQGTSEAPIVVGDDARLIVVDVEGVRVSDAAGAVKDWVIVPAGASNGVGGA